MAYTTADNQRKAQYPSKMGKKTYGVDRTLINQFYHLKLTVFVSILAWPVTYIFNAAFQTIDQTVRPLWMMASGFLILISVVGAIAKCSYEKDWVYFGSVLFAFTAVIDLIITLEFNGVIHNFMSEYLNLGEPYLASPWGSAIALFDGIGLYIMYLMLVHLISNGKNWRSLGIYWASAIINSMIVLVLGIFTGKHSPTFCTFLNVPYVLFPIFVLIRALTKEAKPKWNNEVKWISMRFFDFVLAFALSICTVITFAKGLTALAPTNKGVDFIGFLGHEKSFLFDDPAPFSTIQAVVYLMYLVPAQVMSISFLLLGRLPSYLWEISLMHAGVILQGQFSVIGQALDPQTPSNYKSGWTDGYFWLFNLFILIVPQLVILRLLVQHQEMKREFKKAKNF